MPDRATISTRCPAKLNLALSVGAPDPELNGLHPIASWMMAVDLCDDLELVALGDDTLSRYAILWKDDAPRPTEIDWAIRDDLAVRAHLALEDRVRRRLPVQLKLEKRIPVGGGLGGGSSNAAAVLRAGNQLFGLGLSDEELADIGAGLGSDVPFFITGGGSALVEGVGATLTPTHPDSDRIPEIHAVVLFPEEQCPTGPVYAAFDVHSPDAAVDGGAVRALLARAHDSGLSHGFGDHLFNDLAQAVWQEYPSIHAQLEALAQVAEAPVHLSGSGSSLFVICDDAMHAEHLAAALTDRTNLPALAVRTYDVASAMMEG